MRKVALHTGLHQPSFRRNHSISSGAMLHSIQRAITKQTINVFHPLMARKVFATSVFKKVLVVFHDFAPLWGFDNSPLLFRISLTNTILYFTYSTIASICEYYKIVHSKININNRILFLFFLIHSCSMVPSPTTSAMQSRMPPARKSLPLPKQPKSIRHHSKYSCGTRCEESLSINHLLMTVCR